MVFDTFNGGLRWKDCLELPAVKEYYKGIRKWSNTRIRKDEDLPGHLL